MYVFFLSIIKEGETVVTQHNDKKSAEASSNYASLLSFSPDLISKMLAGFSKGQEMSSHS